MLYFQLRQLRVVRRSLPADVIKTVLHVVVTSRLDYCNSLYYGLPGCDINKPQRVQNAAARLFGGLSKFDHVTPIMRDKLHWLPVQQRIDYKIAVLTYKAMHHMAPDYLTEMCHTVSESSFLSRNRSAIRGDLMNTRWNTVSYGQRGFYYAAPRVWNSLPVAIRQRSSIDAFQRELKTFFFRQGYNC